MYYTCNSCLCAALYGNARSCYCRCRRHTAEKGYQHIAYALCYKLLIAVKLFILHSACARTAQKALDKSECRNTDCREYKILDRVKIYRRNIKPVVKQKRLRYLAYNADIEIEYEVQCRCYYNRHKRRRDDSIELFGINKHKHYNAYADCYCLEIQRLRRVEVAYYFIYSRSTLAFKSRKVVYLTECDYYCYTRCKACNNRRGYKLYQSAELEYSAQQKYSTRHKAGNEHTLYLICGHKRAKDSRHSTRRS